MNTQARPITDAAKVRLLRDVLKALSAVPMEDVKRGYLQYALRVTAPDDEEAKP